MLTPQLADIVTGALLGEISDVDTPIDDPPAWLDQAPDWPLDAADSGSFDDELLLLRVKAARQGASRAHAEYLGLLAEADRRGAAMRVHGMDTGSWLASGTAYSARAAKSEVRLAGLLAGMPAVGAALVTGRVSVEQAGVICHGLARVEHLEVGQRHEVAAHLVELAGEFGPVPLRRLVNHAVEVIAPEVVDEHDRTALERAEARAFKDRFVSVRRDGDGSLLVSGKFPALAGDLIVGHLTALASTRDADTSRGQGLADALVQCVAHHADCEGGPARGGDRARVIVTIGYDDLKAGVGVGTLLGSEEPVTAGQVRRLACAAGVLPVVLGGDSLPLDVGREQRLFTPAQRAALAVRDRGCAFPGCDKPPADCETHHITPWSQGGRTDLADGVLLCAHHHHLVEPDPRRPDDRNWRIDLDPRGKPRFTSPINRTGQRITRQHHRYRT